MAAPILTSPTFQLYVHSDQGIIDLIPNDPGLPGFTGSRMRIQVSTPDRKILVEIDHFDVEIQQVPSARLKSQGVNKVLAAEYQSPDPKLRVAVTFGLSQTEPLFLWNINIRNESQDDLSIEKIDFLRVGGQERFGKIEFPQSNKPREWSFFSNGWQSWSPTGAYPNGQPMRVSRLGFLQQPMIINPGTPALAMPGYYSADFYAALVDLRTKCGLTVGFLSQRKHFCTIEAVLFDRPSLALFTTDSAILPPDDSMETDWAVIAPFSTETPDPLRPYVEAVAREHELTNMDQKPIHAGWCSWYHYYSDISAEIIRKNLDAITNGQTQLPLQLVQIDDGFETSVGDWFSFKSGFPDGVAPLAKQIKANELTPGLWLAPFILNPKSKFARQHPELILRNKRGKPVNAGFGWNNLATAIDLTVPGAMELALEPIKRAVHEWGFPYLKLDFLYAAALPGFRHDPTQTRAKVMRLAMENIRQVAGDTTYLVGCGLPLGAGIGTVDAMRIGADVAGTWEPEIKGIRLPFRKEPAVPSARNSIHNIITRAHLHQRWWTNDPDCLLVRPGTHLTLPEVQSLASGIGMTGGLTLISDEISTLPAERLKIVQALLPMVGKRAEVLDLFEQVDPSRLRLMLDTPQGEWTVAAYFNWSNTPQQLGFSPTHFRLAEKPYWVNSFWDEKIYHYTPGVPLSLPPIPPHGVFLAAIFPIANAQNPRYLGSNLHFSQGTEVKEWQVFSHEVKITLNLGRQAEGWFQIFLPSQPVRAESSGDPLSWHMVSEGVYRLFVNFESDLKISIAY